VTRHADPWIVPAGALIVRGEDAAVLAAVLEEGIRVCTARGSSANVGAALDVLTRCRVLAARHRQRLRGRFADEHGGSADMAMSSRSAHVHHVSASDAAERLGVTTQQHVRRLARSGAPLDAVQIAAAIDVELRRAGADRAVQLRQTAEVSVVDAKVGQAAESATHPTVILTSDVDDMTRLADTLHGDVRAVGI
jgi:hypothetical protein